MFEQRRFEELARELRHRLPGASASRTRDVIQIDYDGEESVVILLTPDSIELRLPTTDWIRH